MVGALSLEVKEQIRIGKQRIAEHVGDGADQQKCTLTNLCGGCTEETLAAHVMGMTRSGLEDQGEGP